LREDKLDRACKCVRDFGGESWRNEQFDDLGDDGRIILEYRVLEYTYVKIIWWAGVEQAPDRGQVGTDIWCSI
jgi:hypothetical protein